MAEYERINWTNTEDTPINADNLNTMDEGIYRLFQMIYPVGSIYMSVNETDPTQIFGGTWEQIKDTFLLSAGDIYENGSVGGETTVTLTVDEMPEHKHYTTEQANSLYYGQDWNPGVSGSDYFSAASTPKIAFRPFTSSVGGGLPHNNMPPYLTVYMWKRIA